MNYPSIDKLLNLVDSKYSLAIIAAKRAKEMRQTSFYQMRLDKYKSTKDIGRALEEIAAGLVVPVNTNEDKEV